MIHAGMIIFGCVMVQLVMISCRFTAVYQIQNNCVDNNFPSYIIIEASYYCMCTVQYMECTAP